MTDKVEEIRERHKRVQQDGDLATPPVSMAGQVAARDAHEDRATLLAEIDRLRARLERLREERDTLLRDARGFLRWLSRHDPITYKDLLAMTDANEKLRRRLDGYD